MTDQPHTIDVRGFDEVIAKLMSATDLPMKAVVRGEMLSILDKGLKLTAAANQKTIKEVEFRRDFRTLPVTAYTPKEPRSSARYQGFEGKSKGIAGKVVYYMHNRYPDALWNTILALMFTKIDRKSAARGLSKKSWLQVAEKLALALMVPAYVRSANVFGKDYPQDNDGLVEDMTSEFNLVAVFGRLYDRRFPGFFQRAITGRLKYFKKNLEKGVFDSLEQIQRAYPNAFKVNRD